MAELNDILGASAPGLDPRITENAKRQVKWYETRDAAVSAIGVGTWSVGAQIAVGPTIWQYDGTSTAISDMPGWVPVGDLTPAHFNGDIASLVAHHLANPGSKIVDRSASTYTLTGTISGTGSVNAEWGDSTFNAPFNGAAFQFSDTEPSGPYALTSDYVAGDTSLAVSSTGAALTVGTRIRIVSDAVDPANRDTGSAVGQYKTSEWAIVGIGSTATNIVLLAPLRFTVGIDPTSATGDEARISAYTTAMNCRVLVMSDEHKFHWRGGVLDRGTDDASMKGELLSLVYYRDPIVEDIVISRGHSAGIAVIGTIGAQIVRPKISNLTDNEANGNYGYGVSDRGYLTRVDGGDFSKVRHSYTTGETTLVSGGTDKSAICSTGRIVGARITFCTATACTSSAFDTHHGGEDVTFVDCFASDCAAYGFAARGRNIRFVRPKARRCALGVYVFTEYNGSVPDGDYYTAGKTLADFTNAIIDSPDIQCVGSGLTVGTAQCELTGQGQIRSQTCALVAVTGSLSVTGNINIGSSTDLGAVTNTGSSAIALSAPGAGTPFSSTTLHIRDGALFDIDGRGGTSAPVNLSGGTLQVDGTLAIGVPDSTSVLNTYSNLSTLSRGTVILRSTNKSSVNVNVSVRGGMRVLWDDGTWLAYVVPSNATSRVSATLPEYATNAAAVTGGLSAGQIYKTSTGELRIVV